MSIPLFFFKNTKKIPIFLHISQKKGRDSVVTTWQKWDLSVLGEVVSVAFNLVGSADLYGDWGLNAPAYFAYDDIAVRFDKNDQTALFNSPLPPHSLIAVKSFIMDSCLSSAMARPTASWGNTIAPQRCHRNKTPISLTQSVGEKQ